MVRFPPTLSVPEERGLLKAVVMLTVKFPAIVMVPLIVRVAFIAVLIETLFKAAAPALSVTAAVGSKTIVPELWLNVPPEMVVAPDMFIWPEVEVKLPALIVKAPLMSIAPAPPRKEPALSVKALAVVVAVVAVVATMVVIVGAAVTGVGDPVARATAFA